MVKSPYLGARVSFAERLSPELLGHVVFLQQAGKGAHLVVYLDFF
jgi:hypothetical protein